MQDQIIITAVVVFLIAGTIKGTVGIGLPTAAIGILTQFTDARAAIALTIFPMMLSNAWQVYRGGDVLGTIRRYWIFAAFLIPLLFFTTSLSAAIDSNAIVLAIGIIIVAFAAISLAWLPPAIPDRLNTAFQALAGILSGICGGLTALWAPPMVIYFLARRLDKDEFVRATGLLLFGGSMPLFAGLWKQGLISPTQAGLSLMLIVPTLIGFTMGEMIRRKLDGTRFRSAVLWMFIILGLNLIRRAAAG